MMSLPWRVRMVVILLALVLPACAPAETPVATPEPPASPTTVATEPPAEPTSTEPAGPSFEAAVYRDEIAGFEFDYPMGWYVGPLQQQSRGGITAFTSWERPTDILPGETPGGETRLDATIQLWDPKGDLAAFVEQRLTAWEASGIEVQSQEEWALSDGRPGRGFTVAGSDGAQAYFFFTTIGDNYLVLSGSGDLALLAEIGHSVRPLAP